VFKAWTDPDTVAAWFGPDHMERPTTESTSTFASGDGTSSPWSAVAVGAEFANRYDIIELVEPELIVLRSDPMPGVGMLEPATVRVEFHDHGAKTRMTLSDSPQPPDGRSHAEAGWSAALDKLAAVVAT
jgi:uncharacterized protein YndB with AHSA1/START domain